MFRALPHLYANRVGPLVWEADVNLTAFASLLSQASGASQEESLWLRPSTYPMCSFHRRRRSSPIAATAITPSAPGSGTGVADTTSSRME